MGAGPEEQAKMPVNKTDGRPTLKTIEHADYLALRANAEVLERDPHGEKVLRLADGSYLKLFRRKRLLSSTAWYPYAQRFADNAQTLAERGIPCPTVIGVYRIPSIARDAVHYHPLAGNTLREIIQSDEKKPGIREKLRGFVAHLHETGIYFRSLHLGNIVLTPDDTLGLIDIADMRIKCRPLGKSQRRRNLDHLNRNPNDRAWLQSLKEKKVSE